MAVTKRGKEPRDDAPDSVSGLIWEFLGDRERVSSFIHVFTCVVLVCCVPLLCIGGIIALVVLEGKGWPVRLLLPGSCVLSPLLTYLTVTVKKRIANRRNGQRAVGSNSTERSPEQSHKRHPPSRKRKR